MLYLSVWPPCKTSITYYSTLGWSIEFHCYASHVWTSKGNKTLWLEQWSLKYSKCAPVSMKLKADIQHPIEEYFDLWPWTCTDLAHLFCSFQSLPIAACLDHHPSKVQIVGMDDRQAATRPWSMHFCQSQTNWQLTTTPGNEQIYNHCIQDPGILPHLPLVQPLSNNPQWSWLTTNSNLILIL